MSDRDNKPRGVPPKTLKAGAPPKLGGLRSSSDEVNPKPSVAPPRQPSALEAKQSPTLNCAENSPAVPLERGLEPCQPVEPCRFVERCAAGSSASQRN